MRSLKTVLAIIAVACSFSGLYADTHRSVQKKHYISDESIIAVKDGLIIETNKGLAFVKKLQSDKRGVFFSPNDIVRVLKKKHVEKGTKYYSCDRCRPPMYFNTLYSLRMHMALGEHRRS